MDLTQLVKERKLILQTYTKRATSKEITAEVAGFRYIHKLGFLSPRIIYNNSCYLTTEYISGISCFEALRNFFKNNDFQKMQYLVDSIGSQLITFQAKKELLRSPRLSVYRVDQKMEELFAMLAVYKKPYVNKLQKILPKICKFYNQNATVPFRDATPKNYILKGINETTMGLSHGEIDKRLYWIDLRSVNERTLPEDDFISVVYHCFVSENIRLRFLKKYKVTDNSQSFVVAGFVRTGRFWARRFYYKKYQPSLFNKRYGQEDLSFYDKQMDYFSNEILALDL